MQPCNLPNLLIKDQQKRKEKPPLFSIITVVFNNIEGIKNTIESVITQKYSDFEYIVIDGGSNDGTLGVIKQYVKYIDIFLAEKDEGIYDAMNKGVLISSGLWVNFMNSGDQFFDDNILKKVELEACEDADVLYGAARAKTNWGNISIKKRHPEEIWKSFCHQTIFAKRGLLLSDPFDLDYNLGADYNFIYRRLMDRCWFQALGFTVSIVEYSQNSASAKNQFTSKLDILKSIWRNGNFKRGFPWHLIYHLGKFFLNRTKRAIEKVSPKFLHFARKARDYWKVD